MSKRSVAKLVCFSRGGDSVEYGGGCHGSGYGTPENPHASKIDDREGGLEIPDGTYAIDKRQAVETEAGYSWVFRGPMCNPDIPDGECDPCPVPSDLFANAVTSDSSNQFGQLLMLETAQKATGAKRSGLDSVSVREYVDGWREHGARIGQYYNGVIVWEN